MIDKLLTSSMLIMVVAALVAVNVFAVRSIASIWWGKGPTIMPFKIVGGDQALGPAMATLLQARLTELQRQLQQVKVGLTQPEPEPASCAATPTASGAEDHGEEGKPPQAPIPVIRLVSVPVSTALFEPLNLSMSVGGVDVGSILGSIQRLVISSREVQFTVSLSGGEAVVAGDLASLTGKKGSVWLKTKEVAPPQIADLLAHKVIAEYADDENLAALSPENFQKLTSTLSTVAELNQRAARGASVRKEFSTHLPELVILTQAAPRWLDLLYFTASVAEGAGDNSKALILYQRLRSELARQGGRSGGKASVTSDMVEAKLKELRSAPPTGFFDDLAPRLLSVTGLFEFGPKRPVQYDHVTVLRGDIEFGFASWSLSRGRLAPLLRKMRETDTQRFYELVGSGGADLIDSLLDCRSKPAEFLAQAVRGGKLDPDWKSRLERLGGDPEFQKVQLTTLEPFFRRAIGLADQWGLRSEQGLAQMFDLVFFRGSMPKKTSDAVATQLQTVSDEHARMNLIAQALVDSLPAIIHSGLPRRRTLYFADPTKSTDSYPSLEQLGIGEKPFRG